MSSARPTAPPAYTATAGAGGSVTRPVPEITLLFLGSPGVGKSTFIAQLPFVRDGGLHVRPGMELISKPSAANVPSPTSFHVSLFARPYKITIYRSTSTLFIDPFPENISCVVFCYAVDDRASLFNVQKYWRRMYADRFEAELGVEVPLMLLGLKRDLRTDIRVKIEGNEQGEGGWTDPKPQDEYLCVMPQQGVRAANEMRCDRYAECSSLTGELMFEAVEDLTRMAAGTTTSNGGFAEGSSCTVM